jgi:hypothetical protein
VRDTFDLVLKKKVDGVETTILTDRIVCGSSVLIQAEDIDCYRFMKWTNANGDSLSASSQ